jgi:iron complex transport system substrate-binding protein
MGRTAAAGMVTFLRDAVPAAAAELPNVGYYRQIAAEGVLSLGPDLVLADADAGPPAAFAQLTAAGVCIVRTRDGATPNSVAARVREVAAALQVGEAGEPLAADIERRLAAVVEGTSALAERPRVLFVLAVEGGAPVAAGRGTQAAAVIELAGGVNAIDGFEGFKPLTPEAAITAAPDVLLVMEHVVEQLGGARAVLSVPALRLTPAGAGNRLIAMDGLLLLGFGPRTPEAVETLHDALRHPPRSTLALR